jgi:hypothetical protein
VSNAPGGHRDDPDAVPSQLACQWHCHADQCSLRRVVSDLPDLPLVGGPRGNVDDRTALALGVQVIPHHHRDGSTQHMQGAIEVDLDDLVELRERNRTIAADQPGRPTYRGATPDFFTLLPILSSLFWIHRLSPNPYPKQLEAPHSRPPQAFGSLLRRYSNSSRGTRATIFSGVAEVLSEFARRAKAACRCPALPPKFDSC